MPPLQKLIDTRRHNIGLQRFAKNTQRVQSVFRLLQVRSIVVNAQMYQGVIYMGHRETKLLKHQAHQCVFIAISHTPLIKLNRLKHTPMKENVESRKMTIRRSRTSSQRPLGVGLTLITVAQFASLRRTFGRNQRTADNISQIACSPKTLHEIRSCHQSIAINKEQIIIFGLSRQLIPNTCPTHVSGQLNVAALCLFRHLPVGCRSLHIGRSIVHQNYLIVKTIPFSLQKSSLSRKPRNERSTVVIIKGNEYRKHRDEYCDLVSRLNDKNRTFNYIKARKRNESCTQPVLVCNTDTLLTFCQRNRKRQSYGKDTKNGRQIGDRSYILRKERLT